MNYKELTEIIQEEESALKEMLNLLEQQYKLIMRKEVFELEAIVDKIADGNRKIAAKEMKRREILGNNDMKDVVRNSGDEDLDNAFRDIHNIVQLVKLQKDTNDLLLKQEISYTNKILNIINPNREIKTYNSYGCLSR